MRRGDLPFVLGAAVMLAVALAIRQYVWATLAVVALGWIFWDAMRARRAATKPAMPSDGQGGPPASGPGDDPAGAASARSRRPGP
jgi:hypothetical protein